MALRCLLYISAARPGLGRKDIDAIVASSQRNNAGDGLTGLLLFNGSNFAQLLEGSEEPLGGLMRRLITDQRHNGVARLVDRPLDRAACSGWAMQPIGIGLPQPARGQAIASALPAGLDDDLRTFLVNFARLN
ncbi:MAG: BLUF domain-containing protein [Novosphingobium sp.]